MSWANLDDLSIRTNDWSLIVFVSTLSAFFINYVLSLHFANHLTLSCDKFKLKSSISFISMLDWTINRCSSQSFDLLLSQMQVLLNERGNVTNTLLRMQIKTKWKKHTWNDTGNVFVIVNLCNVSPFRLCTVLRRIFKWQFHEFSYNSIYICAQQMCIFKITIRIISIMKEFIEFDPISA